VENKLEIMQHISKMQQIPLLPKYTKFVWEFLCVFTYANADCLNTNKENDTQHK